MEAISFTSARRNLAQTIDKVRSNHTPLVITRKGEGVVVMMSVENYEALEETAYLLRSPENARRLIRSIAQLEAGQGTVRELIE